MVTAISKAALKLQQREREIQNLVGNIIEIANHRGDGSICLVPVPTDRLPHGRVYAYNFHQYYAVSLDSDYNITGCSCLGGHGDCKHKEAVSRFLAPKLAAIQDYSKNHLYKFIRDGVYRLARRSQLNKTELADLRAQEEQEATEARKAKQELAERGAQRDWYNDNFDPNYTESCLYA